MNKRKRVGDNTELCRTSLFISLRVKQWPSTTAEMERPEKKQEKRIQSKG